MKAKKKEVDEDKGKESRYACTLPLPTMLYKGRLMSCVNAQSAEEALINLDCTIGTFISLHLNWFSSQCHINR